MRTFWIDGGKHDPEALQESIDAIKEETANMKELVEQLLFWLGGDNHTLQLELEHFDLGRLVETVHREAEMIDADHKFEVEAREIWISADQGLIKQAIRILVDNAIKYTPAGGGISLRILRNEKEVRIAVQDSGIGIPPAQDIPPIFSSGSIGRMILGPGPRGGYRIGPVHCQVDCGTSRRAFRGAEPRGYWQPYIACFTGYRLF